jgi:hypothetical protein
MVSYPPGHWRPYTLLVEQYCAACGAVETARIAKDFSAMEKASRLCLAYATALRITPQVRYDAQTAYRHAMRGRQNEAAAHTLIGGDLRGRNGKS